jgi:hypothetical protein
VQGARNGRRDQRHLVFSPARTGPQCRELRRSCQGTTFVPEGSAPPTPAVCLDFSEYSLRAALSGMPGERAPDPHTTLI